MMAMERNLKASEKSMEEFEHLSVVTFEALQ